MATSLFSSTPSLSNSNSLFPLNTSIFRNHAQSSPNRRKYRFSGKIHLITPHSSEPISENSFQALGRRDLMVFGISSSASLIFPSPASIAAVEADEEIKMSLLVDDINAYSFMYPVELPSEKFLFKWVESRKPERYSSAAPLSPDARQRIVSERVDMIDNVVISVSIGPPNPRFLTSNDKYTWNAKDVADSVFSDKSALRITSGQRMAESSVLDAHSVKIDGEPYWYYEYLVRKSPTKSAQESNIFRHSVASTAERDGYLYSLNASTLSKQWDFMAPFLEKTVASFRLLPPTESYVPPYKDPWRFW
ncbi:psbP domain protein (Mog1/PsbP/DUF1795-like photosystem II reaction center PsbP family protein) [Tasmannia lanceolata]|uniref:psbP domain protein (Mog1/PsbP/DUF1795-like photosystem II reaction center PsbP family protein) n=1 Tax=Tasmannia lanceolata TaxID=3420 RepID=UPI00406296F0